MTIEEHIRCVGPAGFKSRANGSPLAPFTINLLFIFVSYYFLFTYFHGLHGCVELGSSLSVGRNRVFSLSQSWTSDSLLIIILIMM